MRDMVKVEIYGTLWCPYCNAARSLFERKGVVYEEHDASDPDVRMEMIQRAHGRRTVPQIFVADEHLGGYDDIAALDRRGKLDPILKPQSEPEAEACV
jgi:glutaredoxin 3